MLILNRPFLLFIVTFLLLWFAAWIGMILRSRRNQFSESMRSDYSVIVGATLTLLGLLIGFTFSMATTRYDMRKTLEEGQRDWHGIHSLRLLTRPGFGSFASPAAAVHRLADSLLYHARPNGFAED